MFKDTLVFITDTDLNINSGATRARMLCYAKALSLKGINIIITSVYSPILKDEKPEIIEKNIYILGNKRNLKVSTRKVQPVIKELKFISNLRYLIQLNHVFRNTEGLIYFLYPSNFALSLITAIYLRLIKKETVFIEKNELHFGIALNLPAPSGIKFLIYLPAKVLQALLSVMTDITEIFFNGMICISSRMMKLYGRFYNNLIRIPILVDPEEIFHEKPERIDPGIFKICYTGTITENRDGIFTLLKSISLFIDRNPDCKIECNLYGSVNDSKYEDLRLLINKYNLACIVKYNGNISNERIQFVLMDHDLLVLPRPSNIQSNYGFSTKLAEYMISGIPVLSTAISDVSEYVVDGRNGFLINELNADLLSGKLKEIIYLGDRLKEIGSEGRKTALKHFNYSVYSQPLYDFLFKGNKSL